MTSYRVTRKPKEDSLMMCRLNYAYRSGNLFKKNKIVELKILF